jgi:hypothetical protein
MDMVADVIGKAPLRMGKVAAARRRGAGAHGRLFRRDGGSNHYRNKKKETDQNSDFRSLKVRKLVFGTVVAKGPSIHIFLRLLSVAVSCSALHELERNGTAGKASEPRVTSFFFRHIQFLCFGFKKE